MRLFVTGIGTDVGKTMVCAVLAEALQADYWKPVQSGNDQPDSKTVASLISNARTKIHPEAYSFKAPVSPHLAADMEQSKIDLQHIKLPSTGNHLIIEGAGGLLVPLNATHYAIDLAKQFDAEVVLVIRNYLGCINHSLLSIHYLLQKHCKIKGLVLNGDFDPAVRSAITGYAEIPVIAELPESGKIDREKVRQLTARIHAETFTTA